MESHSLSIPPLPPLLIPCYVVGKKGAQTVEVNLCLSYCKLKAGYVVRLRGIKLCIRVTSKSSLKIYKLPVSTFPSLLFRGRHSHQVHLINLLNCSEKIGCPLILFYVIFKGRLSLSSLLSFHHFLTRSPPVVRCSCLEKLRQGHLWSP